MMRCTGASVSTFKLGLSNAGTRYACDNQLQEEGLELSIRGTDLARADTVTGCRVDICHTLDSPVELHRFVNFGIP